MYEARVWLALSFVWCVTVRVRARPRTPHRVGLLSQQVPSCNQAPLWRSTSRPTSPNVSNADAEILHRSVRA